MCTILHGVTDKYLSMFNPVSQAREGTLLSPSPLSIRFCQLIFPLKFPNFLEVKIDINRVILTPYITH